MISGNQIEENLYELYADLAASGLVAAGSAAGFDYIIHPGFGWPNMTWRAGHPDFVQLTELCKAGRCPRLVLFEEKGVTAEIAGQMKPYRFIPAAQWVNMFLPLTGGDHECRQLECRIANVSRVDEWNDWAGTASEVLFKKSALDGELFGYGVRKGLFKLITGYFENRPVCTTLLYLGKLAGVYMVATLPAFQGKGLARELMQFTASVAASAGYSSLVLHSTQPGLPLYNKLGFREQGKLLLYYCMS